jgi:hypothetical protein
VTGTAVTATFSQPMDPATINSSPAGTLLTFTLKETASGNNVAGTVAMNAANTMATFTPTASALTPNTSYTATVTTAAKNAGGTAMANPIAWSFTTKAAAFAAQAPVGLGTTSNFVILTKSGVTNTGSHASVITGNIGSSPITAAAMSGVFCTEIAGTIFGVDAAYVGSGAVTCFAGNPPAANKTLVDNAVLDMGTAYNDAAGRTSPDFSDLGAGNIGGLTLVPGLYKWSTGVLISTDVTISGGPDDVWIFQIAGDITQANGIKVNLAGGAQAKNIFWQVGGGTGVAIGTTAQFKGTVLAVTVDCWHRLRSLLMPPRLHSPPRKQARNTMAGTKEAAINGLDRDGDNDDDHDDHGDHDEKRKRTELRTRPGKNFFPAEMRKDPRGSFFFLAPCLRRHRHPRLRTLLRNPDVAAAGCAACGVTVR